MNGINRTPFLSICIPTFNRAEHVFNLVKDILRCQSNEIEVVVMDNCSTDETKKFLSSIDDNRFVYIQNSQNIGGMLNSVKVLTVANGKYALLCLDRDYIESQYILSFIDSLQNDKDVVFGCCSFEVKEQELDVVFEKGFDSVLNMAYISGHPSGYFYKSAILKKLKTIEEINTKPIEIAFYHELVNAEISFFGSSKRINIPIITASFLKSKDDLVINKSHSYNDKSYFGLPSKRIFEFSVYIVNASNLNLNLKEKKRLISNIFFRGLVRSTWSYKDALLDQKNCSHYNLNPRKVSFMELLIIDFDYSMSFMKQNVSLSFYDKSNICILSQCKLSFHLFKYLVNKTKRKLLRIVD